MEKELEVKYLEALGEGDHEAFNMLFMSYHSLVKRFLFGFIKEEDGCWIWPRRFSLRSGPIGNRLHRLILSKPICLEWPVMSFTIITN